MRRLFSQYLVPTAILFLSLITGSLIGTAAWGIAIGGLLAIILAAWLAKRANARLQIVEQVARRDTGIDLENLATTPLYDEIDHALQTVAQRAINTDRRFENLSLLLAQQAQLLDRMNDGLMRVSLDGRVTYANVAAGSIFGGRNPTDRTFMSVTRDHELNRSVRLCLETGIDQQHTLEIPGDGTLINAVSIRLSQHPAEALVMLRDITEVNRLQNLRRDFVSNVSHELRTPLSTIKILAETLLEIRADDDEATEFLMKIDNEVDSMTALVRDLLDLTRLETFGGRLVLREIEAEILVQDVVSRMQPLADRHSVTLVPEIGESSGFVIGDERRLHQALVNLITNAIVHTPVGNSVVVGAQRDGAGVRFFVRDTGIGIAASDLPRIWERFFKTDKARTGSGTGLGLAIVKHIVHAHAGSVSATSELGRGSEFSFSVPDNLGPVAKLPPEYENPVAPN